MFAKCASLSTLSFLNLETLRYRLAVLLQWGPKYPVQRTLLLKQFTVTLFSFLECARPSAHTAD